MTQLGRARLDMGRGVQFASGRPGFAAARMPSRPPSVWVWQRRERPAPVRALNRGRNPAAWSRIGFSAPRVAVAVFLIGATLAVAETSPLTLTNCDGRELRLPEPPARLAVAGRASFMIVHAAALFPEARDRLRAAAGGRQLRGANFDFLVRAGRVAPDLEILGAEVGPEQLASRHPDLVLLKSVSARLGDALAKVGIPTFSFDLETPEQYERELVTLGRLLGNPSRAEELVRYYRECRARVAEALAAPPAASRPRVLLVQASARGGARSFSVPPADWMQTRLVELAGGVPVWRAAGQGAGWTVVSLEQAAVWNPDVVLVVDYGEGDTEMASLLRADPVWRKLAAVSNGRVWTFPRDLVTWDQPDPRWGLGLMWIAKRLHADRFAGLDLWAETIAFYRWYGLTETEVAAQIKPRLRGDWR